tara:strand:+ start:176 stop:331 length:156 start_codon:yes stop_codon:yes gene_type:complete
MRKVCSGWAVRLRLDLKSLSAKMVKLTIWMLGRLRLDLKSLSAKIARRSNA